MLLLLLDSNGIFDLILETVITKKETVLVSGQEYPTALVKSKFLKLDYSHIEYVMDCMGKNTQCHLVETGLTK